MLSAAPSEPADGDKSARQESESGWLGNGEIVICGVSDPLTKNGMNNGEDLRGYDAAPFDIENKVRKSHPANK